jgi:hypothetical protein
MHATRQRFCNLVGHPVHTCLHLGGVALAYAASSALQQTLLGELFLLFKLRVNPSRSILPLPVLAGLALPGLTNPREPAGLGPWLAPAAPGVCRAAAVLPCLVGCSGGRCGEEGPPVAPLGWVWSGEEAECGPLASRGVAPAAAKAEVPGLRAGAGSEAEVVALSLCGLPAAAAAAAPVDLASERTKDGVQHKPEVSG